jgi:pimeloyl-ACP methyl ester carboxylesterase
MVKSPSCRKTKEIMNLYFISGLGADKRIFQNLVLPEVFRIYYIEWVAVSENETMESYCRRLSSQINQQEPFSLVGVSFGGVIAVELAKLLSPVQTVLVSSFCYKEEVPWFYILIGKSGIYKMLPPRILLRPNNIAFRLFGAYKPEIKILLKNILEDTDPAFFEWAIRQLFSWDNHWKPANLIRIHGTADKILPYKKIMGAIPVKGGEHLMVYSKSAIVSQILTEKLRIV